MLLELWKWEMESLFLWRVWIPRLELHVGRNVFSICNVQNKTRKLSPIPSISFFVSFCIEKRIPKTMKKLERCGSISEPPRSFYHCCITVLNLTRQVPNPDFYNFRCKSIRNDLNSQLVLICEFFFLLHFIFRILQASLLVLLNVYFLILRLCHPVI